MGCFATCLKLLIACFLPPVAVLLEKDRCDKDVWINLLLTILIFIPGMRLSFHCLHVLSFALVYGINVQCHQTKLFLCPGNLV